MAFKDKTKSTLREQVFCFFSVMLRCSVFGTKQYLRLKIRTGFHTFCLKELTPTQLESELKQTSSAFNEYVKREVKINPSIGTEDASNISSVVAKMNSHYNSKVFKHALLSWKANGNAIPEHFTKSMITTVKRQGTDEVNLFVYCICQYYMSLRS